MGLPPEILRMDKHSQEIYREALAAGKEKVYNIHLMVVGHLGVGKTTLTKRIFGEKAVESPHVPTKGIEPHVNIVSRHAASKSKNSKNDVSQDKENNIQNLVTNTEQDLKDDIRQEGDLAYFVRNCGTMKHLEKIFCYVTVLDFAGQFVFYTTHQTFMSWRTIYLLVTDMSKSLDDLVKGDISSLNMESSIKGREGQKKDEYFDGVRRILKDRPQRFLLKGSIAISNIGPDADIKLLKEKIFELAEKQDYWGEEILGRWLVLEQKLMEFKRKGVKA
ncbi:hypothetical protein CHS0354_025310 [Potamilus streckersoni]|uniref:Uncharacterized protein n=1 Tax=Potamilus streckersoni TaxID=2493646 RepID=A0AAE0VJC4_9BIVA|nr:hypothetical protein CHS0354_025310 [Potamilus streckersoni]